VCVRTRGVGWGGLGGAAGAIEGRNSDRDPKRKRERERRAGDDAHVVPSLPLGAFAFIRTCRHIRFTHPFPAAYNIIIARAARTIADSRGYLHADMYVGARVERRIGNNALYERT
jgi:hypothetical protein